MRIEFIGPPAAGKSALCSELSLLLEQELPAVGFRVRPPVDTESRLKVRSAKSLHAGRFLLMHPILSSRVHSAVRCSRQESTVEGFRKMLNLFSETGRGDWRDGTAPISEQGVLQAIWSVAIGAEAPDISHLVHIVKPFLPDLVIHVSTDLEELQLRLEQRTTGKSRLDYLARPDREAILRRSDDLFTRIVSDWKTEKPDSRYLEIRNSNEADRRALARQILDSLPPGRSGNQPPSPVWILDS